MNTVGSLFSGYGGLTLAVEKFFNARTIWHSEIEPAPIKVLNARFPGVPNLGDITKIDWQTVERPTIIDGGSPCQDISLIGARQGMVTGTRSGLWESMREGIAILRPKVVVWENVRGALSAQATSEVERTEGRVGAMRALGRVLGDLASLGYDAAWGIVRASDAGAPHQRARVFVLATTDTTYLGQVGSRGLEPANAWSGPNRGTAHSYRDFRGTALEPAGTKYGVKLNPAFNEWAMGLPEGWVTQVPGISRADQLKMLGNGVVPPQAGLALHLLARQLKEG